MYEYTSLYRIPKLIFHKFEKIVGRQRVNVYYSTIFINERYQERYKLDICWA